MRLQAICKLAPPRVPPAEKRKMVYLLPTLLLFFLVIAASIPENMYGQQTDSRIEFKDPAVARSYALYFPGAGYAYTKEYGKAALSTGISVVALYKAIDELGCSVASDAFLGADLGCGRGKVFMWLAVALAPYAYGIFDAPNSALRANAKLRGVQRSGPLLEIGPRGDARLGFRSTFH